MTGRATYDSPPTTLADIASPYPFFALAAVGLVIGYWWLPAWFLAAQLIRVWSASGGVRWLSARGVAEYTDEKYAAIIGYALIGLIAVRVISSINWLESFQILGIQGWADKPDPQQATYLAVILGISVAVALGGVLRTNRLPWLLAAAGLGLIMLLSIGADGWIWRANTVEAAPLLVLAFGIAKIAMFLDRVLDRRAARRAEEALEGSDARA
jgi:hypothetical protein